MAMFAAFERRSSSKRGFVAICPNDAAACW
jgi:hypothetical protein